ncbi:MAG: ferritin [Armatimonadetes bacterium]|nr:ferritin [Armatimonadota bacterium]
MMISETMAAKLNEQVNAEFYSSYLYLGMACWFDGQNLKVFARRFFQQAEEEWEHGMKILKYLLEVGAAVQLKEIACPKQDWKSPEEIIETTYNHEIHVTNLINDLMRAAVEESDYATQSFLKWFVDEQVEEVSSMNELLALVRMAGPERIMLVEQRLAAMMG